MYALANAKPLSDEQCCHLRSTDTQTLTSCSSTTDVPPSQVYRLALSCVLLATDPLPSAQNRPEGRSKLSSLVKRLSLNYSQTQPSTSPPSSRPFSFLGRGLKKTATPPVLTSDETGSPHADFLNYKANIPGADAKRPLTKEFLRKFRQRMSRIYDGKRAPLRGSDPKIVYQLAVFSNQVMKKKPFKDQVALYSTVAFLAYEFLRFCGYEAFQTPMSYVQVLRDEAIDCLRYECSATSETRDVIDEFVAYAQYVQSITQTSEQLTQGEDLSTEGTLGHAITKLNSAVLERGPPAHILPTSLTRFPQKSASLSNLPGHVNSNEQLISWVRIIFHVDRLEHELMVKELSVTCTPKAGIDGYRQCIVDLERHQHPTVSPDDFSTQQDYANWRKAEIQQLNQLIAYSVTVDPSLLHNAGQSPNRPVLPAAFCTTSNYSENEDLRHPHYICIPKRPKEAYKVVLRACLTMQVQECGGISADQPLLSHYSLQLLREISMRWRICQNTRDVILLDCLCELMEEHLVAIEHVQRIYNSLEKIYSQKYPTTTILQSDLKVFYQLRIKLSRLLHQRLETLLLEDVINYQAVKAMAAFLDHLHADPDFRNQYLRFATLVKNVAEMRIARAMNRYKCLAPVEMDDKQALQLAQVIYEEGNRFSRTFPKPIIGVDIAQICLETFAERLSEGLNYRLQVIMAAHEAQYAASVKSPAFDLYHTIKQIERLLIDRGMRNPFQASLPQWFIHDVDAWLDEQEAEMPEWVENALANDTFEPVDHHYRHSSSVDTLLAIYQEKIDFINALQWPDELDRAKFITRLSKCINDSIMGYCSMMNDLFAKNTENRPLSLSPSFDATTKRLRRLYSRRKPSQLSDAYPNDLNIETCICLNNIEFLRHQVDKLYYDLDVDEIGLLIEEDQRLNGTQDIERNSESFYLYTVKVVLAENLAESEMKKSSDDALYVVLQSGEVEMARTRMVSNTAAPRWDASFDFSLNVSVEVQAIVMHRKNVCGTASFRLQPSLFQDYFAHDIWLDLQPQGRLLLRVSMEGERNDIRFYFGKTFRTLKRTQTDMLRVVVDQTTQRIRQYLSEAMKSQNETPQNWFRRSFLMDRGDTVTDSKRLSQAPSPQPSIEESLEPLKEYLEKTMALLGGVMSPRTMNTALEQIWKAVLQSIENLLVPALSAQPTKMKPLKEAEVDLLMESLKILMGVFEKKTDYEGLTIQALENAKYQELMTIYKHYYTSTADLIEYHRTLEQKRPQSSDTDSQRPRRNKSLMARRNLGTIRQLAKKKQDPHAYEYDSILRILRLRSTNEARQYISQVLEERTVKEDA